MTSIIGIILHGGYGIYALTFVLFVVKLPFVPLRILYLGRYPLFHQLLISLFLVPSWTLTPLDKATAMLNIEHLALTLVYVGKDS